MHFFAKFEPDENGFLVTFPALPEAITGGSDEAEATANAVDALEIVLLTYVEKGLAIPPRARCPNDGAHYVSIAPSAAVSAKLAFIQAFRASGMTRTALASKLGKAENEVRRMLDPYHATKLQSLDDAMHVLGKRLVITVEEIA